MNVITDIFDRVYIAKYAERIGIPELSKSFETTNSQIIKIIEELKTTGVYGYYKDMPENEWENLSGRSKKRQKELIEEGIRNYQRKVFKQIVDILNEEKPIFERYYDPTHMPEIKTTGEDEEWKQIGKLNYEISNYGRIKNTMTKKIKKLKFNKYGVQVLLWQNSKSYTITISRLVANYFIREVKENERVRHMDGQIRNNYYKNLEIVSK